MVFNRMIQNIFLVIMNKTSTSLLAFLDLLVLLRRIVFELLYRIHAT